MAVDIATSTLASQKAIGALNHALAPFQAFSTDFSSEIAYSGMGVAVTVFGAHTGKTVSGTSGDVDYAANASLNTTVQTVTLSDSYYASSALKSAQYNNMSLQARIEMKTAEIRAVIAQVFAVAETALKAQAATFTLTTADTLTFADVVALRKQAIAAGHNPDTLSLILPPTLYATLASDETISKSFVEGTAADSVVEGRVNRVAGMNVFECSGLETGFLVTKQSAAIACRYVPVDGLPVCVPIVDEVTGLCITCKEFPNPNTDQVLSVSHLYAGFTAIPGGYSIALENPAA